MRDERRLARQAAGGDRDAFTAIFRRFQQDLYRYCVAILGNPEDAQDALQNTMVKALGALPGETREIDLKPWLYRIAHNESIDLVRRRRQIVSLAEDGLPVGATLAEEVETRQRLRQLIADVGALPERQRGALLMREAGGLEFEEIGAALGTSPAVARQTLYEARLGLREMDAGRSMECAAVTKALSEGDRRTRRRRDIGAHLEACAGCRLFAEEIDSRRKALASITPLPAVAAAAMLKGLVGGGGASGAAVGSGAGAAGGTGTAGGVGGAVGAGKAIGTATLIKGAATVAAVAAIGVGGADVGGLLHHPAHDGRAKARASSTTGPRAGRLKRIAGLPAPLPPRRWPPNPPRSTGRRPLAPRPAIRLQARPAIPRRPLRPPPGSPQLGQTGACSWRRRAAMLRPPPPPPRRPRRWNQTPCLAAARITRSSCLRAPRTVRKRRRPTRGRAKGNLPPPRGTTASRGTRPTPRATTHPIRATRLIPNIRHIPNIRRSRHPPHPNRNLRRPPPKRARPRNPIPPKAKPPPKRARRGMARRRQARRRAISPSPS